MIGIDLGTTNSLCAVFDEGHPRLIPNAHGRMLTPSIVGVLNSGEIIVGEAARELRVTRPEQCAARFKRLMGTDETLQVGSQRFTAPQLSSLVLKSLRHDAEQYLGRSVTDAVITVPAYFNDQQRRATRLAGELAGLNVCRMINEPTAAALTYGFHDRHAARHLMVVDLGGGTFDVTVMEVFEGTLEILATAGESMLGGEDFTDRLVAEVLRRIGLHVEHCEMREPLRVARLRQLCETAKLLLASENQAQVNIPDPMGVLTDQQVTLTRDDFHALAQPLLERLSGPLQRALRDSQRSSAQIDNVILVGGATRMTCLKDYLIDRLRCQPRMDHDPDQVVALGAAVQAALLSEDRAVDDMVMTDVCPHTLGVEVVKRFGQQVLEGYYSPIIHRNTTLPVSQEHLFSTAEPNQQSVKLRVYQGEGRKVRDNQLLGELTIDGFPPQAECIDFIVRFTYDLNGILEVEAIVPLTGKRFRAVMTQSTKGLSQAEIESALAQMQKIKFYPRDELENQRLLRYCERLVGEVSPFHRAEVEAAIDQWEQAMSSGNRELFDHAKQGLLLLISQLGFDFDESKEDPK